MKNIYVGNMSFDLTEDELRTEFEAFGQVSRVSIITDKATGRPRGFGFVEMANDNEAQQAIQNLNGKALKGRAINVNEARGKTEGGGGGGGGGYGGGGGGGYGGGRGGRRW
jgi:RNA recognition motif-containing protein